MRGFVIVLALATLYSSQALAQTPILKSLPSEVQQRIEGIRESCPSTEHVTKGDEGLQFFTVAGAQAVLVDELSFCGGGVECMHGVNCATGYTQQNSFISPCERALQLPFDSSFASRSQ